MAEFVGVTSNPSINSGVTTGNPDNRPSTAPTPPHISSRGGLHWFAHGAESSDLYDETDNTGKENSIKDHEERLRLIREKHDEERQRKLEELKLQALTVQRCREQKEEERRRRLEEIRLRENDRRQQVEERKRQISEAEQEKRDALLKRNLEREARIIESKKRNDRGQQIFAFGSSTPRMLIEPSTGGSYWATRRSTSTSNVSSLTPMGPLTSWRSSERVLNDCSVKKRAASAGGLSNRITDERGDGIVDRNEVRRRKTDLMPTITSPRDQTPSSRPGSASSSRRSPGRASSMTRLDGAGVAPAFGGTGRGGGAGRLSSARSMSHLAGGSGAGGRSAALCGVAKDRSAHHRSMIALNPVPPPRLTRAERLRKRAREFANNGGGAGTKSGEMTPSRPPSSMSQSITGPSQVQPRPKPLATSRKPRPVSIAGTGISLTDQFTKPAASVEKPPLPKVDANRKTPKVESKKFPIENNKQSTAKDKIKNSKPPKASENIESPEQPSAMATPPLKDEGSTEISVQKSDNDLNKGGENIMTTSMNMKIITTEEEAKAALAERRRLVREQAEKEAELERQRLEAEALAEEERIRCEEEEQRRAEEEQLKLLEEAQKAEALRLQLAIEEQKKRIEEEKKLKEEELKMKLEKEEADRKAKEEAEKMRQEMEIKLKKEEEERKERREKVNKIMARTRTKNLEKSGNVSTKEETKSTEQQAGEKTENPLSDPMTTSQDPPPVTSDTEALLIAERNHSSDSTPTPIQLTNDTLSNGLPLLKLSVGPKQNGHSNNDSSNNGVDEVMHHDGINDHTTANGKVFDSEVKLNNVTNNLLDLSLEPIPSDALSTHQIIDIGMSKCIQDNTTDFTAYQETNRSEQHIVNDLLS